MTPKRTLRLPEVCALLEISTKVFRTHRDAMERHGFPKPLGGFTDRWSYEAVVAYINGGPPSMADFDREADELLARRRKERGE